MNKQLTEISPICVEYAKARITTRCENQGSTSRLDLNGGEVSSQLMILLKGLETVRTASLGETLKQASSPSHLNAIKRYQTQHTGADRDGIFFAVITGITVGLAAPNMFESFQSVSRVKSARQSLEKVSSN